MIDQIKNVSPKNPFNKIKFESLKGIGWRKIDLYNAIKSTGLNIPQGTGKFKINKQGEKKEIMMSKLAEILIIQDLKCRVLIVNYQNIIWENYIMKQYIVKFLIH